MSEARALLKLSDGSVIRFGADESDVRNVPLDIQHETQIPGGYANASLVLPRPPDLHADDARLFAEVEIYDDHGTFYEGDIFGTPQVGEDIRLELVGPIARLDDDKTFRRLWVDRDLSRWGEPSTARRVDLAAVTGPAAPLTGTARVGFAATDAPTPPGLVQEFSRLASITGVTADRVESWYSAQGLPIGNLRYDLQMVKGLATADWRTQVYLCDDDVASAFDAGTNHAHNSATNQVLTATSTSRRYALIVLTYYSTAAADGQWQVQWRNIRVFGVGTPPIVGSAPNDGFHAHDLIAEMLSDVGLDYSIGQNGSIEPSPIVVLQAAFLDPTTRREVIEQLTAAGSPAPFLNDWGVYDGKFFWKTPGTYGRTWIARSNVSALLDSAGPDASQRCNGLVVTWRDAAGASHTAGPPGSRSDIETEQLLDTDPANPANRRGRVWQTFDAGLQASSAGAILLGQMKLSETNRLFWRGTIDLTGDIETLEGETLPAAHVRAGDRIISAADHFGFVHPIVHTSYTDASKSTRATVGGPPETLPALMGQLGQVAR